MLANRLFSNLMIAPPMETWIPDLLMRFDQMAMEAFHSVQPIQKEDGSVVTRIDQEVSKLAKSLVLKHSPQDGLISEEDPWPWQIDATRVWVLDPIDGTASFVRGFPVWGLGLGAIVNSVPAEGHLSFPAIGNRYSCEDGNIFINGQPHTPIAEPEMQDIRNVLVGSTTHDVLPLNQLHGIKLRNFGSHLFHLLSVGLGQAEAMIAPPCKLWDPAAALPFSRARGCVERYVDGQAFDVGEILLGDDPEYKTPKPLVIGSPRQVEELLNRLS